MYIACPPCTEIGPERKCFCSKTAYRLRCGEAPKQGRSCDGVCDRVLSCGKHRCKQICHAGPCTGCEQTEVQACFCGKVKSEARPCGSGESVADAKVPAGEKQFSCRKICGKALSCGNHNCTQTCHAGACTPCMRTPIQPPSARRNFRVANALIRIRFAVVCAVVNWRVVFTRVH